MIYIDTNVILDILLVRQSYQIAKKLMVTLTNNEIELCISTSSFTDISYVLHKNLRNHVKEMELLIGLCSSFKMVSVEHSTIEHALALDWEDIEDCIVYLVAKDNNCDAIITNNIKDFSNTEIPVCTPTQYLEKLL